jgi:hypothetical protein
MSLTLINLRKVNLPVVKKRQKQFQPGPSACNAASRRGRFFYYFLNRNKIADFNSIGIRRFVISKKYGMMEK